MKKLTRSKDDRVIAGVIGGLGEYYQTDPVVYRLIALLIFFLSGIVPFLLVYIIAIFLVPNQGEKEEQTKKRRKTFLYLVLFILTIIIILPIFVMLFGLSFYKISSSYQVTGTSPRETSYENIIYYQDLKIEEETINNYLKENIISPNFQGQVFSNFHLFLTRDNKLYVWAIAKEYYLENNNLKIANGKSLPLIIFYHNNNIVDHFAPRSGSYYSLDIRNNFPKEIHDTILNFSSKHPETIESMKDYIKYQAINYYDLN